MSAMDNDRKGATGLWAATAISQEWGMSQFTRDARIAMI